MNWTPPPPRRPPKPVDAGVLAGEVAAYRKKLIESGIPEDVANELAAHFQDKRLESVGASRASQVTFK